MAEPLSPVQNQTIVMKVGHESSHLSSLQQYATIAASMNSAQNVVKRAEREASSTTMSNLLIKRRRKRLRKEKVKALIMLHHNQVTRKNHQIVK